MENAALSPAYTRSQWKSSVVPMPTAGPHTAATTGLEKVLMPRKKRNTGESMVLGLAFRKSPMSLPALKMVSWPWNTTARTAGSACACARASAMLVYMAAVMAFFLSTRFRVMVSTPALVSVRISLSLSFMVEPVLGRLA